MTEHEDKTVNRRRLLRRAGTVAAGVAGTTVVGAAVAAPAQAAPGDPVVQGGTNAAGATITTLTSTAAGPTLQLANTSTATSDGAVLARPALRLTPSGDYLHPDSPGGSIGMDSASNLQVVAEYGGGKYLEYVHTTGNSNQIVSIVPQRVVDTRSAGSRARILNASSTTLDSSGRLRDGQTIHLDLSDFVFFSDALFGNLTVTTAVASGFVQIFPYGSPRPANFSTINYLPNQVISNSFMSGVGYDEDFSDVISVYAARTTHIIIDVVAFVIGVGQVYPDILPFSAGASARSAESAEDRRAKRAAAAKQGTPSWK
ncbi:hypothetical protein F8271_00910 [Micromonospora sp. ALFpr18c]|uniref:hypothetical protein n=1 Tax=unclassified Micromonospora TaxID=2617518 RepID=UPI00124AE412|nr:MULTISPECIES: hypothetical protein [unclassified Micromonospora]KAB1949307.1 hypothetical protein F8271_00910 [Micromonospora sp. ALFpr18c]MDG4761189.1 hypothetical protein [Micromonospora sp. WMMD710]